MIKPSGWYILVQADEPKKALKNELIAIPDSVLDAQRLDVNTGTVVGVGPLAWKEWGEPWAVVGDHIIYVRYGGKRIQDPDTDEWFILLNDKDVIGHV